MWNYNIPAQKNNFAIAVLSWLPYKTLPWDNLFDAITHIEPMYIMGLVKALLTLAITVIH